MPRHRRLDRRRLRPNGIVGGVEALTDGAISVGDEVRFERS